MDSSRPRLRNYVIVALGVHSMASLAVEQAWIARHASAVGSPDRASDNAVDSAGDIYVTGSSTGASGSDFVTLKLDARGNQIWTERYDGPAGRHDYAVAAGIDPAGGVYVTGRSQRDSFHYEFATISYDATGEELWVARYSPRDLDPSVQDAEPAGRAGADVDEPAAGAEAVGDDFNRLRNRVGLRRDRGGDTRVLVAHQPHELERG